MQGGEVQGPLERGMGKSGHRLAQSVAGGTGPPGLSGPAAGTSPELAPAVRHLSTPKDPPETSSELGHCVL